MLRMYEIAFRVHSSMFATTPASSANAVCRSASDAVSSSATASHSDTSSRATLSALTAAPRGVFTSWAMPAARRPKAAIFSADTSCSWLACRVR